MWQMSQILLVVLSLLMLFINGGAVLLFLNYLKPKEKFSNTEVVVYSFSLGYAVLTLIGIALAQFGLLIPSINLFVILIMPFLALCRYIYQKQKRKLATEGPFSKPHSSLPSVRLSHVVLLAVFALGIILRLESQLTVTWLGDMDPYYHLSFIDAIIAQGTLPSRTLWGHYSYPPSFHIVFATLLPVTQADRFIFMKTVPEFLEFLCVPAAYALIKRKYGEWAGIASAAFLSIDSFHIYRTNIAIPEPLALFGILMFFHALTTQVGTKKYLLAGLFASMVFLTNIVGMIYFIPSLLAIFVVLLLLRRWRESIGLLKATILGLVFSGLFWLPILYRLGLSGILEGLGPSYHQGTVIFTSNTYFSWIGWGACVFAVVGAYICLKDFKNHIVIFVPAAIFIFLFEAANNGYYFLDANLLFRGLLYLGTWISLLAGVGFGRIMKEREKIAVMILIVVVVLTMLSFPVFSRSSYPVNWEYNNIDFVYRSYLNNYANIFKGGDYKVYAADLDFNYGAFNNVILDREVPQIREAALKNDTSTVSNLISEYKIRYMILLNGTAEAAFLAQIPHVYKYYEDWHTIVLAVE